MTERITLVHELLDEIEGFTSRADLKVAEVSDWSVGQQIDHVLKATSTFTILLLRNRPADGTGTQRQLKEKLLQKGSFPRGLVQAPDVTRPDAEPSEESLKRQIRKCRNRIARLSEVSEESVADHPYLGEMQRDEVIAFLAIHLRHHLSIIRDIVEVTE